VYEVYVEKQYKEHEENRTKHRIYGSAKKNARRCKTGEECNEER
jgi:hypothetical protein